MSETEIKMLPVWEKCPDCDDYFCNLHDEHAYDCICPPVDYWIRDCGDVPYDIKIPVIFCGDEEELDYEG